MNRFQEYNDQKGWTIEHDLIYFLHRLYQASICAIEQEEVKSGDKNKSIKHVHFR